MKWRRVLALISLIPALIITAPPAHAGLYSFSTHTFTPCSATGTTGPTLAQCQTAYGTSWSTNASYYTVTAGIQYWTAPYTGVYQVTAAGAVGVGAAKVAGRGAIIRANVSLTQGAIYKIVVGQAGTNGSGGSGGGGGGTFLTTSTNTPIIIAGGGGGALGGTLSNAALATGQTTTSGANSSDNYGSGGTNGGGGYGATGGWGGGGGGLSSNGTNGANCVNSLGYGFINGATGGSTCSSAYGGFGGGAGTHGNTGGGGGGGGYSGGGGSGQGSNAHAGGGGSFIIAGATLIATSNGSYAGSSAGITNLNAYNGTYGSTTLTPGYLTITAQLDPVSVTVTPTSGGFERTVRTPFQLTATLSDAGGRVTFYQQGKKIAGCIQILTATTTATCTWSPTVKGSIAITATVSPTSSAIGLPSNSAVFYVGRRTTTR